VLDENNQLGKQIVLWKWPVTKADWKCNFWMA